MITFKEYLAEGRVKKLTGEDGEIRFLDNRNIWVGFLDGKIATYRKTKEGVEKFFAKNGTTPVAKVEKPKATAPVDVADEPVSEDPVKIEPRVFKIPEHNMDFLDKKIEKLNKIAAKLGVTPITVKKGEPYPVEQKPEADPDRFGFNMDGTLTGMDMPKKYINFQDVTIEGEAPKLDGWEFVGKREPLEGADSILAKSMPGQKLPKKYADDHALTCDHCKKRANRSATFVVKKGKKHMEVGRSCLKDFLGHANPEKYADFAEMLSDIEASFGAMEDSGYEGGHSRFVPVAPTVNGVAAALRSIRDRGFVSNQYAGEKQSTSQAVNQHFNPPIPMPRGMSFEKDFKIHYTPEDVKEAEKIVEWMRNHPKANKEEFWNNISKIAKGEGFPLRMTGYIAAGVNMHEKEAGNIKKSESLISTIKNEGAGKEGDKITVKGTVLSSFAYQSNGQWGGTKHIVTVKTDNGHIVKMFTSSGDSGVKKDARVEISGKIGRVEPETYDRSPFKGMMLTTMAPRSRIESIPDATFTDKHYHVGDKIKFTGKDGKGKIGQIVSKPVFGQFEVKSITQANAATIHVSFEDILGLM
jgi:hypothetical protein